MAADITTSLAVHYKCDDASGSTLADDLGAHSATTVNSPTWSAPGIVGTHRFNCASASSQRASVATWADIQGTGAKTISFWFNTSTATVGLLSWGTNSAGQACRIELEAGVLWMRCATGTGNWGGGFNDGRWHHVVFLKPSSATMNQVVCIVDGGTFTGTFGSGSTSLNWGSANPLYIGWDWGGTAGYLNGSLDDIRIYTRQLAAEDYAALFALGYANIEGPDGWWKLDETSGVTAYDASGTAAHGTYTNTPTLGVAGAFNRSKSATFASASSEYITGMSLTSASTNTVTMAGWIYPNGTQSAYTGVMFSRGTNVNGLHFDFVGSRKLAYCWNNNAGTYNWTGGPTLTDLTWTHIAMVISPVAGHIYVNGVIYNNNVVANTAITSPFASLEIARDSFGTRYFNGGLDDMRIYHRGLNATDILKLSQYKPARTHGSMLMAGAMLRLAG